VFILTSGGPIYIQECTGAPPDFVKIITMYLKKNYIAPPPNVIYLNHVSCKCINYRM